MLCQPEGRIRKQKEPGAVETAEKFGEMEEVLAQKGFDREQRRYMLKIFETVLRNFAKAQDVPVAELVRDLQVKGTKAAAT